VKRVALAGEHPAAYSTAARQRGDVNDDEGVGQGRRGPAASGRTCARRGHQRCADQDSQKEIIEFLRQRSRPYLFSNTLAPAIAATTLTVLDILSESTELRDRLEDNTRYFRGGMAECGFDIPAGDHPIVPIMLGDAALATKMASMLLDEGIYVIGFSYPVVPKGKARIRVQVSACHSRQNIDLAMDAFAKVNKTC